MKIKLSFIKQTQKRRFYSIFCRLSVSQLFMNHEDTIPSNRYESSCKMASKYSELVSDRTISQLKAIRSQEGALSVFSYITEVALLVTILVNIVISRTPRNYYRRKCLHPCNFSSANLCARDTWTMVVSGGLFWKEGESFLLR